MLDMKKIFWPFFGKIRGGGGGGGKGEGEGEGRERGRGRGKGYLMFR